MLRTSWFCVLSFTILSMNMFDRNLLWLLCRDFEFIYLALMMTFFGITSIIQALAVYQSRSIYLGITPVVALADLVLWCFAWLYGSFFVIAFDACLTPRRTKIVCESLQSTTSPSSKYNTTLFKVQHHPL